ncbi:MAG: YceI family protein [Rhodospirillales bacterium]|nr:YceI family protein [Rhodospirillales bacterium]
MIAVALAGLFLLIGLPQAAAQAPAWTIDAPQSRLSFTGTQAGSPFEGAFKTFEANVNFDPQDLEASRVVVQIDVASMDTGSSERDQTALDREWFAVEEFPQARFESTGFRALGGQAYEVNANLTIRDVTRPVTLPFTLALTGDEARAKGELSIDRTDYGVGQGQWASGNMVGREVRIGFDLLARRAP